MADGDIEQISLRFLDKPGHREMKFMAPVDYDFSDEDIEKIMEEFDKERANDPDTIRQTHVFFDHEMGRQAVSMAVFGSEKTLQDRAGQWGSLLYGEDGKTPVDHMWSMNRPKSVSVPVAA